MVLATNLGFPRIGPMRELKKAVEAYWKGKKSKDELLAVAKDLRAQNWKRQKDAGIVCIGSVALPSLRDVALRIASDLKV